jgi:hypothetical protein
MTMFMIPPLTLVILSSRTARLAIMFTIIRITFPYSTTRRVLYILAGTFVLLWIILAAQLLWVCEGKVGWKVEINIFSYMTASNAAFASRMLLLLRSVPSDVM